jgi:hypothetical protein
MVRSMDFISHTYHTEIYGFGNQNLGEIGVVEKQNIGGRSVKFKGKMSISILDIFGICGIPKYIR